jgi:hypothetical protein
VSTSSSPASVRLPDPLRARIEATARRERRSFSNCARVLLELGLAAVEGDPEARAFVDEDEVERLAVVARDALRENGSAS